MPREYTNLILSILTQTLLPSIIEVKVEATPNSVCHQPGFYSISPCAHACIGCLDSRGDQIAYMIGCGSGPPNECWCATNLFTAATTALSNCVSRSCTIGGWQSDYTAAEAFYTSYCEVAGFTGVRGPEKGGGGDVLETTAAGGGPGAKTTTSNGNEPPRRTGAGTGTGGGGEVGSDGPVTEGQSGLSSSDRIALGVGIGLGLPATIAGVVTCVIQLRARSRRITEGLPGGTVR